MSNTSIQCILRMITKEHQPPSKERLSRENESSSPTTVFLSKYVLWNKIVKKFLLKEILSAESSDVIQLCRILTDRINLPALLGQVPNSGPTVSCPLILLVSCAKYASSSEDGHLMPQQRSNRDAGNESAAPQRQPNQSTSRSDRQKLGLHL